MQKLRLLLDVDEVICFSMYLEYINEFLETKYVMDDFTEYYLEESVIPRERMPEFNDFIKAKNLYEKPTMLPGAIEAIKRLSKYYDIFICSDCINPFAKEDSGIMYKNKYDFLYKTFPQEIIPCKNYIFTGAKDIFIADVQVDDLVRNFGSNVTKKFLFPSYHNKEVSEELLDKKGITRAGNDWQEGWHVLEKQLIDYFNSIKESNNSVSEKDSK